MTTEKNNIKRQKVTRFLSISEEKPTKRVLQLERALGHGVTIDLVDPRALLVAHPTTTDTESREQTSQAKPFRYNGGGERKMYI